MLAAAVAPTPKAASSRSQQTLGPWGGLCSAVLRPTEHDPLQSANAATGTMRPTAQPALKNVSVEYIRSMLFEMIRDGEVSDSERKMMLWSIIVLAQVRDKCGDTKIAVPSCPEALSRYLVTQAGAIGQLMSAVQGGADEGVRECIFAERSPTRRAWVGGLDAEGGTPEGAAERVVASAAERGLGWLMHMAGTQELVQQATPAELMLACEPPRELDLCARHGRLVGACLGSLGPIVPASYMFRERAADFYRLWSGGAKVDLDLLLLGLRFFLAAFVYAQLKKVPAFLVGALYVRVFICTFDERMWVLGRLVQLLRLMAEKATDWDRNDEWVGCPEGGVPSAIQLLPDSLAELLSSHLTLTVAAGVIPCILVFQHAYTSWRLRSEFALAVALPVAWVIASIFESADSALSGLLGWLVSQAVQLIFHPVARAVLNYTFAVVLAKLLIRVMDIADEVVQPKLVLMSLKLGARARSDRSAMLGARARSDRRPP